MHFPLVIGVPMVSIIRGVILNSIGLSFDQPPSFAEQDLTRGLAAERASFRQFFDRQQSRAVKQKGEGETFDD